MNRVYQLRARVRSESLLEVPPQKPETEQVHETIDFSLFDEQKE